VWRRDAALAIAVSVAAAFGLSRLGALIYDRFHTYAPVRFDLGEDLLDSTVPGAGFLFRGLIYGLIFPAAAGVVIYLVEHGLKRRAWWLWVVGALLVISAGPGGAHSLPEFLVGWGVGLVRLLIALGIGVVFFRNNPPAFLGAAFCMTVAAPLVAMLDQPAAFFTWNGVLLGLLTITFLARLLTGSGKQLDETHPAPVAPS
jgi:hypothetical protein